MVVVVRRLRRWAQTVMVVAVVAGYRGGQVVLLVMKAAAGRVVSVGVGLSRSLGVSNSGSRGILVVEARQ